LRKSFIIALVSILSVAFVSAQGDSALVLVDKMPEFPGGVNSMMEYINDNIKFPPEARERGESGKAFVKFLVDTGGKIVNPVILKSSGSPSLDKEALRVIKSMPLWTPGVDKEKKVKVYITVPFSFKNLGTLSAVPGQAKLSPEQRAKHELAMQYWNEGHKFEKQGNFKNAQEEFTKSLNVEPQNKYALFDKGKMHMALGEKDKACEIWNKMIQSDIRKNEAEEFVKTYCGSDGVEKMALYYRKQMASGFFDQGVKILSTGRYEAALHKFDSCLKYNPDHKDALFNKAQMHLKLDQKKAACESWKKLLILNPSDIEVAELIKKNCN
jgi:TonB family protein